MPTLFVKNVVTIAINTNLATAAQTYEFIGFGSYEEYAHCELCHQRIKRWSAVINKRSGIQIRIGLDCHDKLAHLQATGELVSLRTHREYVSRQKEWIRKNITASVFAWLKANAPAERFADAIRFIDKYGYPRSIAEGEALVAYYKAYWRRPNLALIDFSKFFCGAARVTQ